MFPVDLKEYGFEKIVNVNNLDEIDYSQHSKNILTVKLTGDKLTLKFKDKEHMKGFIHHITNGVIQSAI